MCASITGLGYAKLVPNKRINGFDSQPRSSQGHITIHTGERSTKHNPTIRWRTSNHCTTDRNHKTTSSHYDANVTYTQPSLTRRGRALSPNYLCTTEDDQSLILSTMQLRTTKHQFTIHYSITYYATPLGSSTGIYAIATEGHHMRETGNDLTTSR
eukprot:2938835-Amphidinium_carterae.1